MIKLNPKITLLLVVSPSRSKNKDRMARNQNNMSEWSDMSTSKYLLSELVL